MTKTVLLFLEDEKLEAILIKIRRKKSTVKMEVGGYAVVLKSAIKYLMINAKLRFM